MSISWSPNTATQREFVTVPSSSEGFGDSCLNVGTAWRAAWRAGRLCKHRDRSKAVSFVQGAKVQGLNYMNSYRNTQHGGEIMRVAGPRKNAPSSGKAFPNLPRGIVRCGQEARAAAVQKRRHVVRIACLMKKRGPEGTLARGLH